MIRQVITFLIVFLLATNNAFACDCDYKGSFLKMSQRTPLIALVKVTKYLTFKNIYDVKTPMSMEVEIIEVYKGNETRKTFVVWGDIGNLCRPYLSEFKEGQYYVIAFDRGNFGGGHPDEKDTDYSICSCGAYWLTVDIDKSNVTGDIDSQNRTNSILSLLELKSRLIKTATNMGFSAMLADEYILIVPFAYEPQSGLEE